jgi:hypothetical protein
MSQRDYRTGRFTKDSDPFTSGRTVNDDTYQSSLDTKTALDRALARAEADLRNCLGGKQ